MKACSGPPTVLNAFKDNFNSNDSTPLNDLAVDCEVTWQSMSCRLLQSLVLPSVISYTSLLSSLLCLNTLYSQPDCKLKSETIGYTVRVCIFYPQYLVQGSE